MHRIKLIAGSLGGAGLFAAASFSTFAGTALGAASIERAGIAGLVAGVGLGCERNSET